MSVFWWDLQEHGQRIAFPFLTRMKAVSFFSLKLSMQPFKTSCKTWTFRKKLFAIWRNTSWNTLLLICYTLPTKKKGFSEFLILDIWVLFIWIHAIHGKKSSSPAKWDIFLFLHFQLYNLNSLKVHYFQLQFPKHAFSFCFNCITCHGQALKP